MHRLGVVALAIALLAPAVARSQDVKPADNLVFFEPGQPVRISADSLEYDQPRDLYVARGRVRITQEGRELKADWMAFSNQTRRGVASGGVVFTDGVDTIYAEFIEFDVDTIEGVMYDAAFDAQRNQMELRGEEIVKTGDRTYKFRNGEFTTCRCPDADGREPWQLKVGEADLEVEGYGTARNARFEVLGVPVGWLPWMIFPLKTERQSGFLIPDANYSSRNGFEVGVPIFIAAGDPVNLLITPRYMSKRGIKGDLAAEYVFGEQSGGDLFGSYLDDREVKPGTRKTPFGSERWATSGTHDFFLADDVRFKARYVFVSDNSYTNDFNDFGRYRQDRYLPSRVMVEKPFGSSDVYGLVLGAQYSDDQQNPDDTDRDAFLLNRLPEGFVHALPQPLPTSYLDWLVPSLDLRYTWYRQEEHPQDFYTDTGRLTATNGLFYDTGIDGIPDSVEQGRSLPANPVDPNLDNAGGTGNGTENDGLFEEGELLADDGHRAVLTPRLGVPFRLFDGVEAYPEVGWQETLYQTAAMGFERRGLLTGRIDLRTRLRRNYGEVAHLIEPRLGWAYVSSTGQLSNPLFVPRTAVPQTRLRELDLENITRDWSDRVPAFNVVTLGFSNRVFRRPSGRGGARVLADVLFQLGYDIRGSKLAPIYLDGRAYPFPGSTARFNLGFDPTDTRLGEALLEFGWNDDRGDRVSLGYRFLNDVPSFFEAFPEENDRFHAYNSEFKRINQIDGSVRAAINPQWALVYRGVYTFERKFFLQNAGGVEYISRCRCWAIRLEIQDNRTRGPSVGIQYTVLGLGDDSRSPFESAPRTGSLSFLD